MLQESLWGSSGFNAIFKVQRMTGKGSFWVQSEAIGPQNSDTNKLQIPVMMLCKSKAPFVSVKKLGC